MLIFVISYLPQKMIPCKLMRAARPIRKVAKGAEQPHWAVPEVRFEYDASAGGQALDDHLRTSATLPAAVNPIQLNCLTKESPSRLGNPPRCPAAAQRRTNGSGCA